METKEEEPEIQLDWYWTVLAWGVIAASWVAKYFWDLLMLFSIVLLLVPALINTFSLPARAFAPPPICLPIVSGEQMAEAVTLLQSDASFVAVTGREVTFTTFPPCLICVAFKKTIECFQNPALIQKGEDWLVTHSMEWIEGTPRLISKQELPYFREACKHLYQSK